MDPDPVTGRAETVKAADVQPGTRVWLRAFERWVTVVSVTPTGRLKWGSDTVPMISIRLGVDARPAKSIDLAGDQDVLIEGPPS